MKINLDLIKKLRTKTGAGISDCRKALEEAKGNEIKAIEILREKGQKIVAAKASRAAKEGQIGIYLHSNGKIGAMIILSCETDFVARGDEFKELVHDLAMQVAAVDPKYLSPEEVPKQIITKEKNIYRESLKDEKKPVKVINQIIQGRLEKFYQEVCLLKQPFIKNDKLAIEQLLTEKIAKFGENIKVEKFIRYQL